MKWDHVKLFLILCVVIGHMLNKYLEKSGTAQIIYYFIYLFHMPAFVMVSGLFSKNVIRRRKYDRIFGYLVLYLFIVFINFGTSFFRGVKDSLTLFEDTSRAWYAYAMFVYFLITIFLQQFSKRYVFILAVVLGCMVGYDSSIGDFLALSRIFVFYPFFLMGYYLDSGDILRFVQKKSIRIISLLIIVSAVFFIYRYIDEIYWTLDLLKGKSSFKTLDEYARYGAALRLFFYVISSVLTFSIIAIIPSKRYFFSYMGERTMSVYALHMILVHIFYDGLNGGTILRKLCPRYYIFLILLVAVLIVAVLSWKPFDDLVHKICFPKTRERKEEK